MNSSFNDWFLKVLITHSFIALPVSMKTIIGQKFHMPIHMRYILTSFSILQQQDFNSHIYRLRQRSKKYSSISQKLGIFPRKESSLSTEIQIHVYTSQNNNYKNLLEYNENSNVELTPALQL
ncbi:cuticle collagen dpy-7 [Trichinella spiralis]|uniref:cuticle collagen dpy-7 n=1 Tax=Trichinella spiralis TaxID=6334 RepID=UPI0001EFDB80|nr:cuticle collagen dpy-7 [Trichinella spiralis]